MKNKGLYIVSALLMVILGASDALRGIFQPLFISGFGFSESQIGLIISASYLGNLTCLLFGGRILDRIGRKKAMAAFIAALAVSEVLLLFGRAYALLLIGFFLTLGISTLLNTTINLISDSFSATKGLLLLNVLFFLQGIGTSGSQLILSNFSSSQAVWNGVLIGMAVLLIPLAIAVLRLKEEKLEQGGRTETAGTASTVEKTETGMIALIALTLGLYLIAEHGITNYIIMYGREHLGIAESEAGFALSLYSAGIMIGRLVLGTIVDRIGGDREGRRRTCLHERNEPAGGELLVYAERTRCIAQLDDERDGIVGVGERDHVRAGCRRVGKEPVNQKGRGPRGGDEKREKALVGLGVVAGQPPDGERVHHYELGEPARSEVCPYAGDAVCMHDASLGRRGSHAPSVAPARPRPNRPLVSPCREIALRPPQGTEYGPERDFFTPLQHKTGHGCM